MLVFVPRRRLIIATFTATVLLTVLIASCSSSPSSPGPDTGIPAAPTNVTATPAEGMIVISWTDNSSKESAFHLYRNASGISAASAIRLATLPANTTRYEDHDVTPDLFYQYSVEAAGPAGVSRRIQQANPPVRPKAPPVQRFTLTVVLGGTGHGTIASTPSGIQCGSNCQGSFTEGKTVTLTATPNEGSTFAGWGGACTGRSTTCVITVNANRSITATFTQLPPAEPGHHSLTVITSGTGSGTVDSNPAGIACGSDCTSEFTAGTSVRLTAQASSGSSFGGWSGACSGSAPTCTISMNSDKAVSASFLRRYTLTVETTGTGLGLVRSDPSGIHCGDDCSESYTEGTEVTLIGEPDPNSEFMGWSDAGCSGTGTCTITMNADRSVKAAFSMPVAPKARFTADPTRGTAPLRVSLDASSSTDDGTITQYDWDFADGSSGSGASTHHTFDDPGSYRVRLQVTDDSGLSSERTETVTVLEAFGQETQRVDLEGRDLFSYGFGSSTDMHGRYAIIGATGGMDLGYGEGVFIYELVDDTWQEVAHVDIGSYSRGYSVASVVAISDRYAVADYWCGVDGGCPVGGFHVIERNGTSWHYATHFTVGESVYDGPRALAISGDTIFACTGNTFQVQSYRRDVSGWQRWGQTLPDGTPCRHLAATEDLLAVSSEDATRVYERTGKGGWQVAATDLVPGRVVTDGQRVAVIDATTRVYARDGGAWELEDVIEERGDIDMDGEHLLVGARDDDTHGAQAGAVRVYKLLHGDWVPAGTVYAAEPVAETRFGSSVALSGDRAVVGANVGLEDVVSPTPSAHFLGHREP